MAMASAGGIWVPMAQKALRMAVMTGAKAAQVLRTQTAAAVRSQLEAVPGRAAKKAKTYSTSSTSFSHCRGARAQPVHPAAWRRQLKQRAARWWSSTASRTLRRFHTFKRAVHTTPQFADRVAYLQTRVGTQAVWKATGRSPFASTLRPNLTGGALPRTAGGYATGGARSGARYFSHGPAAPAQVVQNVSQAMRAFWVSGQRARFDGTDGRGRPCYAAVSALEEETARRLAVPALPKMAPGAFVDFALTPTITALAGFSVADKTVGAAASPTTLGMEGFLDVLSVDFSRALKDLSATLNDLRALARLGDLPVLLASDRGPVLRVRFPGVDADSVDRLCSDLGVTRGVVGQDPGCHAALGASTALRFPLAPDGPGREGDAALPAAPAAPVALTSPGGSLRSHQSQSSGLSFLDADDVDTDYDYDALFGEMDLHETNPWLASLTSSEAIQPAPVPVVHAGESGPAEYEGLEGVYRFLEECDRQRVVF